jgi:very-short-patch-repair endonuclease
MARILAAIAERAGQQLGLITRQQLAELGVTPDRLRTLTAEGLLVRAGPRVFRLAAFPRTHRQRLLEAAWVAGPGGVVSHLAAAGLWGFDGIQPTAVEVSVPGSRAPRAVRGRVHRVSDLLAVDVTERELIPVTTPSRTLIDAAPRLQLGQLEMALDGACRCEQIHLPYLEWRIAELRRSGRAGISRLDELLRGARRDRGEESWLESTFLRLLRDAGLPPPRLQVVAESGGPGGRRYRLDGRYDEQRLVVEIDGHATHATRRQRQADAERDMRLQAQGLRVIRFTYEDVVERPAHVVATIAQFLGLDLAAGA